MYVFGRMRQFGHNLFRFIGNCWLGYVYVCVYASPMFSSDSHESLSEWLPASRSYVTLGVLRKHIEAENLVRRGAIGKCDGLGKHINAPRLLGKKQLTWLEWSWGHRESEAFREEMELRVFRVK